MSNEGVAHPRPIFIHAFWRTGSTYIWKKFREQSRYRAYYEPLHECLTKPQDQIAAVSASERAVHLRHPAIDNFYFAEIPFTENGGAEFFEKPLSYERYCLGENAEDQALRRYIANLLGTAERHGQTPVLQFNRSLLRSAWLTRNFSPINILIVRRPFNVWKSLVSFEDHSFTGIFCIVLGQNRRKPPLKFLPQWIDIPFYVGKTIEDDYAFYRPVTIANEWRLYPRFFDFYVASTVQCAKTADCILDLDELSVNREAQAAATARLERLGISIDFGDCSMPSYTASDAREQEWLAYESVSRTLLRQMLPEDFALCRSKVEENRATISPWFHDLLTEFTKRTMPAGPQHGGAMAERAAQRHAEGILLFEQGAPEAACHALEDALAAAPTSERWNDWATAQFACGRKMLAELGYRQGLGLEPDDRITRENLAALLVVQNRTTEAGDLLRNTLQRGGAEETMAASSLSPETCVAVAREAIADAAAYAAQAIPRNGSSARLPQSPILQRLQQQSTMLSQIALRLISVEDKIERIASKSCGVPSREVGEKRRIGVSPAAAGASAGNGTHVIPKVAIAEVVRESAEIRLLAPAYVPSSVSLPELVVLLHLMLQTPARNVFEFGTYLGRTSLNFALNSPAEAQIHTLDMPSEWQKQYGYNAGQLLRGTAVEGKVSQLFGDSLKFDFSPYFDSMDFIFVDASHGYEHVLGDSRNALKMLRNGTGVIAWHDYGWEDVAPVLNGLFGEDPRLRAMRHIQDTSLVYVKLI